MTWGTREMKFQLGKRWVPTLNATIRKLKKHDPSIRIDIQESDLRFIITMESDHQDFIRLNAKLRNVVLYGQIEKKTLKPS